MIDPKKIDEDHEFRLANIAVIEQNPELKKLYDTCARLHRLGKDNLRETDNAKNSLYDYHIAPDTQRKLREDFGNAWHYFFILHETLEVALHEAAVLIQRENAGKKEPAPKSA